MNDDYPFPVSQLLSIGDVRNLHPWPDYLSLGIEQNHTPLLIKMGTDPKLNKADSESLEVWAPIHAWRTLGLLRSEDAILPLMALFEEDDDWTAQELPEIYALIGSRAIPALSSYLANSSHDMYARAIAAHCLERIGTKHPEVRSECIAALTTQLEQFKENEPELNAFLIGYLVDLKAVESAQVMEDSFASDFVDESIVGDWEDVQIELGLIQTRTSPPTYGFPFLKFITDEPRIVESEETTRESLSRKAKKKTEKRRKMAKLSRKRNRKRR